MTRPSAHNEASLPTRPFHSERRRPTAACPGCQDLQAKLQEAREELLAWSLHAVDEAAEAETSARLVRWTEALDISAGNALLLLAFVDHPGRVWSRQALLVLLGDAPGSRGGDVNDRAIDTRLKKLRKALRQALGQAPITVTNGLGWTMARRAAADLVAFVEGSRS